MNDFAFLLQKHLDNLDLKPNQLAERLGIPQDTVDAWLDNKKTQCPQRPNNYHIIKQCVETLELKVHDRREFFKATGLFAHRLKQYMRSAHHITANKLADMIDMNRKTVGEWLNESSLPGYCDALFKCAEVLSLSMTERDKLLEAVDLLEKCQKLSPCVVGKPITEPQQFFGRHYEIKRILNQWSQFPLQNIAIIGGKGSGKTSLLYYLGSQNKGNPLDKCVYVDFKLDPRMRDKQHLLLYLLNQLDIPIPEPCDLLRFMDTVTEHLHTPTFIFLDDIDVGLEEASNLDRPFWDGLRALSSHRRGGKLAFLMTSRKKPWEVAQDFGNSSPFFNIFGHVLTLGPLLEDEARELLKTAERLALLSGEHDAEAWEWILEKSQRLPMLLQILADCYIKAMKYGEPAPDKWREECLNLL